VVIIGQDPYHGKDEATCVSVNDGVRIPPSLRNIGKMNEDLETIFMPTPVI
jgi:uracil-DNA glycosylase